jgi:hypothetical protein
MALVHIESDVQKFEQANNSKIAEAEALAAEALRMANEAKRAAERLAEVKKSLALFYQKLEKVEKDAAAAEETAPSTPVKIDEIIIEKVVIEKEEVSSEPVDAPVVEEKKTEEIPAPVAVTKRQVVAPKKVQIAPVEKNEAEIVLQKAFFEAALDDMGLDKLCGVDEETLAREGIDIHAKPPPAYTKIVKKVSPKKASPTKTVETKKAAPAPAKKVESLKKVAPVASESQIISIDDEEIKDDLIVQFVEHIGIDRFCGVDDATLGLSLPKDQAPPPEEEPFENPTRLEYKDPKQITGQIVHAESWKEHHSNEIRQQRHLAPKVYQRVPTNYEFADPFGVDHDDFVMCGRLADLCEPDLDALEQPVQQYASAPKALPPAERSILKKAPKEEDITKVVSFQAADEEEDVSSSSNSGVRGVEPAGTKDSYDSQHAQEVNKKGTHHHVTRHHYYSAAAETTRTVNLTTKSKGTTTSTTTQRRHETEDSPYDEHQIQRKAELLDAIDSHLWCV